MDLEVQQGHAEEIVPIFSKLDQMINREMSKEYKSAKIEKKLDQDM